MERKNTKQRTMSVCCLAVACLICSAMVALAGESRDGKIRVLLTYGGHGFQKKPFFEMFDKMPGVEYTRAEMPDAAKLLEPGLKKQYDVIVRYDMVAKKLGNPFSTEQRKAFVALLKEGIGVVALHHNIAAHQYWNEYADIIGAKFFLETQKLKGESYGKSGWDHGQDIDVEIADKEHPIAAGLKDFRIHDETYSNYYTSPDAHVLLKTEHPRNDPELAWVTCYGNSPVFYLMLGHDDKAWNHPAYSKLLLNAIRWTCDESRRLRDK